MITICSTKTKTSVVENNVRINCFSDENDIGNTRPNIYSVNLLSKKSMIDGVSGKTGELIVCFDNERNDAVNIDFGEFTIKLENDVADNYVLDLNGNLIYNF